MIASLPGCCMPRLLFVLRMRTYLDVTTLLKRLHMGLSFSPRSQREFMSFPKLHGVISRAYLLLQPSSGVAQLLGCFDQKRESQQGVHCCAVWLYFLWGKESCRFKGSKWNLHASIKAVIKVLYTRLYAGCSVLYQLLLNLYVTT